MTIQDATVVKQSLLQELSTMGNCPSCFDLMTGNRGPVIAFDCIHRICKICAETIRASKNNVCPFCRKPFTKITPDTEHAKVIELIRNVVAQSSPLSAQFADDFPSSQFGAGAKYQVAVASKNEELTHQILNEAAEANPEDTLIILLQAEGDMNKKQYARALRDVNRVLEKNPESVRAKLLKAKILSAQGKPQQALDVMNDPEQSNPDYCAERGRLLFELGNHVDAKIAYDKALKGAPRHVEALVGRADCHRKQNDLTASLTDLAEALDTNPNCAQALSLRGLIQGMKGEVVSGLSDLQKAAELTEQKDAQVLRRLGEAYRTLGRYIDAKKTFAKALELEPNIFTKGRLADIFCSLGDLKSAQAMLEEVLKESKNDAFAVKTRRRLWMAQGDVNKVMEELCLHIEAKPTPALYLERANLHLQLKNLEKVKRDFMKVHEMDPKNIDVMLQLAEICFWLDEDTNMFKFANKVLEVSPTDADARAWKALFIYEVEPVGLLSSALEQDLIQLTSGGNPCPLALAVLGCISLKEMNYDKAEEYLNKALSYSPNCWFALVQRAELRRRQERFLESVNDSTRALQISCGRNAFLLATNGASLLLLRRDKEALLSLSRSIEIKPNYRFPLVFRCQVLRLMGNHDEAINDATTLIQGEPQDPEYYELRARAYFAKEDMKNAAKDCEMALKLNKDNLLVQEILAICYFEDGRYEDALRIIQSIPQAKRTRHLLEIQVKIHEGRTKKI